MTPLGENQDFWFWEFDWFNQRGNTMREMVCGVDQGVSIGETVNVTVLEVRENSVRLGISCPRAQYPDQFDYWEETVQIELPETAAEPLHSVR